MLRAHAHPASGGKNGGLHNSPAGTGRAAADSSSRTFSSGWSSFPDGGAATHRTQAGVPIAKGRKPIAWSHSLGRKIERARQYFHFIPFDKQCKALRQSGGPGKSSVTDYIEHITGDTPSKGILQSRGHTIQGFESLVEEARTVKSRSRRHESPPAIWTDGPLSSNSAPDWAFSERRAPVVGSNDALEASSTQQSHLLGPGPEKPPVPGWSENEEAATTLRTPLAPSCHKSTPSRSSIEQNFPKLNLAGWQQKLAEHLADKLEATLTGTGVGAQDLVDLVINRKSAGYPSESIRWSRDTTSAPLVPELPSSFKTTTTSTLCLRLAHPDSHDGAKAAEDLLKLIESGADPNLTNDAGESPLHTCVRLGFDEGCGVLLWAGANPNLRTNEGKSIGDIADDASKAAGKHNDDELASRIHKCGQLVSHGLEGVKEADRKAVLLDLCHKLDSHPGRCSARQRELDNNGLQLAEACTTTAGLSRDLEQRSRPSFTANESAFEARRTQSSPDDEDECRPPEHFFHPNKPLTQGRTSTTTQQASRKRRHANSTVDGYGRPSQRLRRLPPARSSEQDSAGLAENSVYQDCPVPQRDVRSSSSGDDAVQTPEISAGRTDNSDITSGFDRMVTPPLEFPYLQHHEGQAQVSAMRQQQVQLPTPPQESLPEHGQKPDDFVVRDRGSQFMKEHLLRTQATTKALAKSYDDPNPYNTLPPGCPPLVNGLVEDRLLYFESLRSKHAQLDYERQQIEREMARFWQE